MKFFYQNWDYLCAKAMLCCVILVTSVDVQSREVAVGTLCQYSHLDSMFDLLQGHVPFQVRTPLKLDRFVDSYFTPWIVQNIELILKLV